MQPNDRKRLAVAITWLAEVHGRQLGTTRLEAYMTILGGGQVCYIERAIRRLATESPHFPKPAEILEVAKAMRLDAAMRRQQLDEPALTSQEKAAALAHIAEFKQRMGWA
jgi:hypothetical protein